MPTGLRRPADGDTAHRRPGDRRPRHRRDRRRLPRRPGAPGAGTAGPVGAGVRAQRRRSDPVAETAHERPRSAVPFLDLKAQQARIAAELRRRLDGGAGALPVHPRPRGRRTRGRTRAVLRREALRGGQFRHRCDPDRLHGGRHRAGRRGVPARLHLYRDGRGAAGAGRDAGVRRCRSAHLPDRSRRIWSAASPRCGAKGGCGRAR